MDSKIIFGAAIILGALCTSAYTADNTVLTESQTSSILKDKYNAGDYWSVGSDGLEFLKNNPDNDELRMMVADSLAWSGRYVDAISQYQMLASTSLTDRATLGLANVYRWRGRPDLASPLYQKLLKSQPANQDVLDSLNRISRMLRARTDLTYISKSDSNSVIQNGAEIKHYWRGDNPALKYELSLSSSRYTLASLEADQSDVNLRFENADMAVAPKLELSFQQKPASKAFASVRLELNDAPDLHMTIGHVNWGNMAFHPQALLDGLDATQLKVDGSMTTRPGMISAAFNDYQVSDGNQVQDSNIQFSPSWRPLGVDFRFYIGLSGRYARRNVPIYWSPDTGYLSTDIGFTKEWSLKNGDYSIYAQRGFHAAGEALNSYNIGLAAKHYIGRDWAASLSAGMLENQRSDAYNSKYFTLGIERPW